MNNKVWVLTYTIGTNEGRKSRRLTCDTKAQAEMQQRVLGGEVAEYIRQPESFQVNWPEKMDVDAVLHEMRQVQNDPAAWKDLYLCGGDAESVRDPFRLVRQAHAEWSDRQFGKVGPVGPLKHLAKEANEAAEAPDDISEFADIIMLVWDATRRAGITDEQLAVAVAEKLERNKRRQWGAVKDGEPCHHLKN
ncbi:putative Eaa-like protein [Klebsiella phage vB_KpnS_SegesCirculi]|uniref:Putative Eaa-like protein n=1 Tax=Klebsiella phage vB_KpnS_SegesCirculi TaxID=2591374 RepID=A0A5B9NEZ3_9CAUD|nr:putative Eaa-like protein [Klebsiella phage vB_KpnS_SegesCirculi]QEG12608.1 putative Eaa-like protein [Klebsiella phage vB_KpnS_SegesCirculi]QPX75101.1 putative Eaa-like protein [Klebsiella phage vB_KpnS_SegesCirculi]